MSAQLAPRGVAALPLVGEVDRARCRSSRRGRRSASGRRPACRRPRGAGARAGRCPRRARRRGRGRLAGGVAGGDVDHDRVADVGGGQVVGRAGGAGDVDAAASRRRRSASTGRRSRSSRCRSRCRSVAVSVEPSSSVPLTTGTTVLTGGAASAGGVWAEPLGGAAADVGGGHDDLDDVVDVAGHERVGRSSGAQDVDAVRAVGVAALPLVAEVDRLRADPGAGVGGQRVRRRAGRRRCSAG